MSSLFFENLSFDPYTFSAYNIKLMEALKSCYVNAPCKINLHLRIKEKRSDGFHELESIFAALDFGDSLRFELTGKEGDWELQLNQSSWADAEIRGDTNLISKAAALFRQRTGFSRGLYCRLEKRIPLASGLGGASSDAAAALLALNHLADTGLSREELLSMAAVLGSDVPFFIHGGAAWVSGRGECIEPLPPIGDFGVLLVKPPFQSFTPAAFKLLEAYRGGGGFFPGSGTAEELKSAWLGPPQKWPFFNDFLALLPEEQDYRKILSSLGETGALFSGLSGSGSCCFGVFSDKKKALAAEKAIKSSEIFAQATFFLASRANPVLE